MICWKFCAITWFITNRSQCPRENQLRGAVGIALGRDTFVNATTGSGKTLIACLNMLLHDPEDTPRTFLMLDPLLRLQNCHAEEMSERYGLSVAVINEHTKHDDVIWQACIVIYLFKTNKNLYFIQDLRNGHIQIIITSPEQFTKTKDGHLSQLGHLFKSSAKFRAYIRYVVVDEAHGIAEWGIERHGLEPFRPAYGKLRELKVLLGDGVPWLALTATAPSYVVRVLELHILRPNYVMVKTPLNRPNMVFFSHHVKGSLHDVENYACLFVEPFDLGKQPYVLVFVHGGLKSTVSLAVAINTLLPPAYRWKGIVKHYHGQMSTTYLQQTHTDFVSPAGKCRVLVTTITEAIGIDFPSVQYVCSVGLPSTLSLLYQMYGRLVRQGSAHGIACLFYESWVNDIDLNEYGAYGSADDLDRPRGPLSLHSSPAERAPFLLVDTIQKARCWRAVFASYLNDVADNVLTFNTGSCCSSPDHADELNFIDNYLPSPLLMRNRALSNGMVDGAMTLTFLEPQLDGGPPARRSTRQIALLKQQIYEWRRRTHVADPLSSIRPDYYILSDLQIKAIARTPRGIVTTTTHLCGLISAGSEWQQQWGEGLLSVVVAFDSGTPTFSSVS
ncbi:P-loop containing nucleoside triphosphate hydrolase protein [Fistulina hepatica ATCC 64428]|uniref:DNA 3'-5' helicase n=1 Tax=Fistulina hepatica ATCC 64428 TaxID=1128425 RepID=A0A0D7ARA2_9AGAR|nr:P-loop containing nucleoside triphosphate hydrolase protein [Fistulina hepatica ATCC 64428]